MKVDLVHNGFCQQLLIEKKPAYLRICPESLENKTGFNTVLLRLDASTFSLLNWEKSIHLAEQLRKQGYFLLWELDFSLSSSSFFDMAAFLSLEIAVEEFMKKIWSKFADFSLGIVFYRGGFFDYTLVMDDIKLLASSVAEEISCFLLLDTSEIKEAGDYFQKVRQDLFFHFIPILKGKCPAEFPFSIPSLGWDHGLSPHGFFSDRLLETQRTSVRQKVALLLSEEEDKKIIKDILSTLRHSFFRVIPESLLTQEWEGIDELIVLSPKINERTKRGLFGFCAAGGMVISESPLGVPNEILLASFLDHQSSSC